MATDKEHIRYCVLSAFQPRKNAVTEMKMQWCIRLAKIGTRDFAKKTLILSERPDQTSKIWSRRSRALDQSSAQTKDELAVVITQSCTASCATPVLS